MPSVLISRVMFEDYRGHEGISLPKSNQRAKGSAYKISQQGGNLEYSWGAILSVVCYVVVNVACTWESNRNLSVRCGRKTTRGK